VDFNPWRFTDESGMLAGFFGVLADKISATLSTKREVVARWIEVAGRYGAAVDSRAGKVAELAKAKARPDLEELRRRLTEALAEAGKRIVILVDDIDRLYDLALGGQGGADLVRQDPKESGQHSGLIGEAPRIEVHRKRGWRRREFGTNKVQHCGLAITPRPVDPDHEARPLGQLPKHVRDPARKWRTVQDILLGRRERPVAGEVGRSRVGHKLALLLQDTKSPRLDRPLG
jgi:hypothetical protein